jgi:ubiquinone/menaquinone biosynthesis C-methylase UbiE
VIFAVQPIRMPASTNSVRSAYDLAAESYARKFLKELDGKPFDRELLQQFAQLVGPGQQVLDVGCGPGHTTAQLTSLGLKATGVDLSPRMIELAKQAFPQSNFEVGDFLALPHLPSSFDGILAFYCIVHLTPEQLAPAFAEMSRVLKPGGYLLVSFHVGSEVIHAENFLETTAVLDFHFFEPAQVLTAMSAAGFKLIDSHIREPYESEHPSRRGYIMGRKS